MNDIHSIEVENKEGTNPRSNSKEVPSSPQAVLRVTQGQDSEKGSEDTRVITEGKARKPDFEQKTFCVFYMPKLGSS